jgi:hypothetical protein
MGRSRRWPNQEKFDVERRLGLTGLTRERARALGGLAAVLLALALCLFTSPAEAQNKAVETQARALQKKAMEDDYLNVDLDKAADKLNQAITKCGTDKCSANLRALLRRDLATVYSAANKKDEALATMVDALKLDGSIQLDANYKTKEIEAIYATAKTGGGGGGGKGGTPSGDFTHSAAEEQAVRTPLPVYAEYSGSEAVTKVVVKYKAFGMTEFKTLELKKMGTGWGANIPCADIQQGDIQYYLQGFNANNDPVATGGDRNNPYKTAIKKSISGEGLHLPGQQPLAQCADTGDCPPDFPGCKKGAVDTDNLKPGGEECEEDAQCKSGTCKKEKCTDPPEVENGDHPKLRRFWIGVSASVDLQFIPGQDNACALNQLTGASANGLYACVDSSGANYPPNSGSGDVDKAIIISKAGTASANTDQVKGGLAVTNPRFLASFDYALNYNMLIGVRAGTALFTYPGNTISAFPPVHLEARYTYVFGKDALASKGFAPAIFLAAGVAPFAAKVGVTVFECDVSKGNPTPLGTGSSGSCAPLPPPNAPGTGTPVPKNVDAWRVGGPIFVAPGVGIRYGLSDRAALALNLKLAFAFGNGFLFDPTPELAFQLGF